MATGSPARPPLGPEDCSIVASLQALALDCAQQRKFDESEALYKRVIDIRTRSLRANSPETAAAIESLMRNKHYIRLAGQIGLDVGDPALGVVDFLI